MQGINLTLVGITVVFLSLIVLSFVISLFSKIFVPSEHKKDKGTTNQAPVQAEIQETSNKVNESNDEELIAVLTAAIMAGLGPNPECRVKIKSFRRIPQTSPVWNIAGRNEYISEKL